MTEDVKLEACHFTTRAALEKEVLLLLGESDRFITVLVSQKLWDEIVADRDGWQSLLRIVVVQVDPEEEPCTEER